MPTPLDSLDPLRAEVGFGELGRWGSLGYGNQEVIVGGRRFPSALSSHAPARLLYDLGGRHRNLTCMVALNDDVPSGRSFANFSVVADGRLVAEALRVTAGESPRPLEADLQGAGLLELRVTTSQWEWCHAVWLEPTLEPPDAGTGVPAVTIRDPLERADIIVPEHLRVAERCIATAVSAGFEGWADDLFGSVLAYGNCPDARLVIFALGENRSIADLAAKYGALYVRCAPRRVLNSTAKAVLYSIARVVPSARYLCLDADMLVLDDLNPLFGAIDACPAGSILLCRESHPQGIRDLRDSFDQVYWGGAEPAFFERDGPLGGYRLPVNDGMFAAGGDALVALDSEMRALPGAREWVDERGDVGWRNQFAFNVAVARLGVAVELDPTWNLQLHVHDVEADADAARPVAHWHGRRVRILHFGGFGKGKLGSFRQQMRAVADPVVGQGSGRGYETFLGALRAWTGRRGLNALAWSFQGTADGASAMVHDPAVFPPLAVLHHLALANGCIRVLETGTCQGISAGCLASAVAHRPGGAVVSFDPSPHPECRQFWSLLPEGVERCIEQRHVDGVAGMRAALERGEVFHLALLDSIHSAEQVWAEWGLASRLVVEGGLVLIHDATWAGGTVEAALTRIEAEGYGVTRLWTATDGVPEEDRLGLAVIENRRHGTPDGAAPAQREETPAEANDTGSATLERLKQHPWAGVAAPPDVLAVPSMLSERERGLLYWVAREYFTGAGHIVDAGCFLGGSTAALAAGLRDRANQPPNAIIASYDLFRIEQYTLWEFGSHFRTPQVGASFRASFDRNLAGFPDVEVHEGDICALGWSGEPIEILFLDIIKDWEVNDVVLAQFFPCLIPGRSLILQQDYHWGGHWPWIHITMELLDEYVEILDWMPHATVAYLLCAAPPADLLQTRIRQDLSPDQQLALMDKAVGRWTGEERGMVELARVFLLAELQGSQAAHDEFQAVRRRHEGHERVMQCAASVAGIMGW